MNWNLSEALDYYKTQGAPADQSALIALLTEAQQKSGGSISPALVTEIADCYGIRETLLLAIIRRIPRLRLSDCHTLELCGGPNCSKAAALFPLAEELCAKKNIRLVTVPCMRMCGQGPNIKFNGQCYHHADSRLLQELLRNP